MAELGTVQEKQITNVNIKSVDSVNTISSDLSVSAPILEMNSKHNDDVRNTNHLDKMYNELNDLWKKLGIDIVIAKNNKIIELYAGVDSAEEFNKLPEKERNNVMAEILDANNIEKRVLKNNRREFLKENDIGFFKRLRYFFQKRLDKQINLDSNVTDLNVISEKVSAFLIEKFGSFETMLSECKNDFLNDIKEMLVMSALKSKGAQEDIIYAIQAELSKYLTDEEVVAVTESMIKLCGLDSGKQALAFEKIYMSNVTQKNPITETYRSSETAVKLQSTIVKNLDTDGLKEASELISFGMKSCNDEFLKIQEQLKNPDLQDAVRQELTDKLTALSNYGISSVTGYLSGIANGNVPMHSIMSEISSIIKSADGTVFADDVANEILTFLKNDNTIPVAFKNLIEKEVYVILNTSDPVRSQKTVMTSQANGEGTNSIDYKTVNNVNNRTVNAKDEVSLVQNTIKLAENDSGNAYAESFGNNNVENSGNYVKDKLNENDLKNNASGVKVDGDNIISFRDITKAESIEILNNPAEFYNYVKENSLTDLQFCNVVFSVKNVNALLQKDALDKFKTCSDEEQVLIFQRSSESHYASLLNIMSNEAIEDVKDVCCYNVKTQIEKYQEKQQELNKV